MRCSVTRSDHSTNGAMLRSRKLETIASDPTAIPVDALLLARRVACTNLRRFAARRRRSAQDESFSRAIMPGDRAEK